MRLFQKMALNISFIQAIEFQSFHKLQTIHKGAYKLTRFIEKGPGIGRIIPGLPDGFMGKPEGFQGVSWHEDEGVI